MNYYDELPLGYEEAWSIDAGDKKAGLLLNLAALVIAAIIIAIGVVIKINTTGINIDFTSLKYIICLAIFAISLVLYIIIHELTHGLFYKIFTHKKLTFGIKLTCAFCGIPTIYSKKIPMIITALAPFVIYSIACIIPLVLVKDDTIFLAILLFFAVHASGCIGDLFVSIKLLGYPKDVLINDTGAKQTFYIKK